MKIGYDAYIALDTFLASLPSPSLISLLDPSIRTNQLLLAYLTALHLVMRPISCRERRQYTVSFYGIRMSSWIPGIWNALDVADEEGRRLMEWPMWVSGLHGKGELERWSLEGDTREDLRKGPMEGERVGEQEWRRRGV